jgi:hypothetical protein
MRFVAKRLPVWTMSSQIFSFGSGMAAFVAPAFPAGVALSGVAINNVPTASIELMHFM